MSRRAAWILAAYALLALIVIPIFPHFLSPNEFTRWATAVAVVELHTFEVTRLLPLFGGEFEDVSLIGGRYYSNKAPGGALFGLPAYIAARALVGSPSPSTMRATLTAMRLAIATVPAVLLGVLVFFTAMRLDAARAEAALLALLFGTPLFAYGMLNFSHALTAAGLFAAWALLFAWPSPAGDYASGALIGIAVLCEYPAAIPAGVIVAFAIGSRNIARVVGGGAPFAIGLAIYNRALFGGFFALSSGFERDPAFRQMAQRGVFGVGLPDLTILMRLLFDPARGLFVFSPVLLVALIAIPKMRAALAPRQFWSLLAVPSSILLLYAGYPNWHGGWTVGARYLIPALPFLALAIAFARSSWLASALLGASATAVVLTSIVFPFVPPNVPAPWGTFAWPLLRHGLIAPNLAHFVGRPLAIAVPLAIGLFAVAAGTEKRAFMLAGAIVWMAAGLAVRVPAIAAVERGFVEEVSFERDGAIARATPKGVGVAASLTARAGRMRRLPPPSWPF